MLVLTRRVNESIVIGNDIIVTVLEIQRDAIRLGIKAPHDVEINREELLLLLSDKQKDAASIAAETSRKANGSNRSSQLIGEKA